MTRDQRSLQIWSLLICAARERKTYTYGDVASVLGFKGAGVFDEMLGGIMWYCRERDLPPLTALVVNQETGQPGGGFLPVGDLDAAREDVFRFDWFSLEPPETKEFKKAQARGDG